MTLALTAVKKMVEEIEQHCAEFDEYIFKEVGANLYLSVPIFFPYSGFDRAHTMDSVLRSFANSSKYGFTLEGPEYNHAELN